MNHTDYTIAQLLMLAETKVDASEQGETKAQLVTLREAWSFLFGALSKIYQRPLTQVKSLTDLADIPAELGEVCRAAQPGNWLFRLFNAHVYSDSVIGRSSSEEPLTQSDLELIRHQTMTVIELLSASFEEC
jgi:hypothetical protein